MENIMYKKIFLLALFTAIFGFSSVALAIDNEVDPGASITVSDNDATDPNLLTFNFSPSVCARYETSVSEIPIEKLQRI